MAEILRQPDNGDIFKLLIQECTEILGLLKAQEDLLTFKLDRIKRDKPKTQQGKIDQNLTILRYTKQVYDLRIEVQAKRNALDEYVKRSQGL